jgi:O-antigen/teichoic acid export membrane protein
MDSVARGTLTNLATRLLAVVGVLLITTITARLGTAQQGAFALFTSVEGLLLALFSGFGVALARRVSQSVAGASPQSHAGLVSAVVWCCLALGALAGLGLWAASMGGPPAYATLWLLALGAPWLLLGPNVSGLWLGQGRMAPMARLTLAPPWLALCALAGLWLAQQTGLLTVLAAWVGAKVVVGAALLAVLWRGRLLGRPDWAALRAELPLVATIALTGLVSLMNYRVGLFVVERWLGLSATGVYSIAVVAAELLWFVSSSLTQAVYGRIGTTDRGVAAATTVRALQLSITALVLAAPVLWLAAWALVPWLLGPAYSASLEVMAVLLPGVLLFGGASALSAYFTNHAGRPQVPALVAGLSLVLNATLSWWGVPLWGLHGAACAASLSYAISVAVLAWLFARHAGLPLAAVVLPTAQLRRDLRAALLLASRPGG